jgi:hypothetical protein
VFSKKKKKKMEKETSLTCKKNAKIPHTHISSLVSTCAGCWLHLPHPSPACLFLGSLQERDQMKFV